MLENDSVITTGRNEKVQAEKNDISMLGRGTVWYIALGQVAKIRPCVILGKPEVFTWDRKITVVQITHSYNEFETVIPITLNGSQSYINCSEIFTYHISKLIPAPKNGFLGVINPHILNDITEIQRWYIGGYDVKKPKCIEYYQSIMDDMINPVKATKTFQLEYEVEPDVDNDTTPSEITKTKVDTTSASLVKKKKQMPPVSEWDIEELTMFITDIETIGVKSCAYKYGQSISNIYAKKRAVSLEMMKRNRMYK